MELLRSGEVESKEQLLELVRGMVDEELEIIIPKDDSLSLTRWWLHEDEGKKTLYVGTEETHEKWLRERVN